MNVTTAMIEATCFQSRKTITPERAPADVPITWRDSVGFAAWDTCYVELRLTDGVVDSRRLI